jgi:hypothetical protein
MYKNKDTKMYFCKVTVVADAKMHFCKQNVLTLCFQNVKRSFFPILYTKCEFLKNSIFALFCNM